MTFVEHHIHVIHLFLRTCNRKIIVDGNIDKEDKPRNNFKGTSGKTQIGTWWNQNNLRTNVEIDTLYIVNKAVIYPSSSIYQQQCYAKVFNSYMPLE